MHKSHVQIDGATPRYMLVPGDPGRVPVIGADWDAYTEVSFSREFRLAHGTIDGVAIGACSTGIGAPSVEIALIDLSAAGSETFVRVGTCASLQPSIELGTLVIQEGAVRNVGSIDAYCERAFPAIADRDVTFALIEACEQLGLAYTVGLTCSTDSFFAGQNNALPASLPPLPAGPVAENMRALGVATFEMEAAALFVLGRLLRRRCGSICAVQSNRATGERRIDPEAIRRAARAASRAVSILAGWDARRERLGRPHISPALLAERP